MGGFAQSPASDVGCTAKWCVRGQGEFGRSFLSSIVVTGCAVITAGLIVFLAATAVRRFRFRLRTTLVINTPGSLVLGS
ncbi:hypothetical protein ADK65_11320 [Streptomyces sp. NRRL B-1140]|nr:hypothetical protein ADK65_11320 [Streptomyces sp. NRRL B-1140]